MKHQHFKDLVIALHAPDKEVALMCGLHTFADQNSDNQNDHMLEIKSLPAQDLIKHAQAQAQQGAKELALKRDKEFANQTIKKINFSCLKPIKKSIEMNRKTKMRIVQHYLCDNCDTAIINEDKGYVVQGNIYVANPTSRGGLVGNNFPEEEVFNIDQVHESVLCQQCLCAILNIPYYEKIQHKGF